MGTKIKYSINLLATLVERKTLAVCGVNVWEHYYQNKGWLTNNHHRTGINKLQGPIMDRMLDKNNIESIKKTMLMHEDIFKHQVRELHRVYSVQKMLMKELKNKTRQQHFWNPMNDIDKKNSRGFDLEKPSVENTFIGSSVGIDEGDVGTSTAFQSCKIISSGGGGDGSNEELVEVDLTLSIGGSHLKNSNMQLQLGECSDIRSNTVTFTQGFSHKTTQAWTLPDRHR